MCIDFYCGGEGIAHNRLPQQLLEVIGACGIQAFFLPQIGHMTEISMEKKRELVGLLEKITYARNVYDQASTGMHSSAMKNEMKKMRKSREEMVEGIARKTGIESVKNGQPPMFEKFWVMLNDLLIQRNTPYILKTCVKADRLVIEEFEKVLGAKDMSLENARTLRPYYEEMVGQVKSFEKEIDQYPWS